MATRRRLTPSALSRSVGATTSELPTLEAFVTNGEGSVTIGAIRPIPCVAVASDELNTLVAIVRRQGKSLASLLQRLDHHLARTIEQDEFVDEINSPMRSRRQLPDANREAWGRADASAAVRTRITGVAGTAVAVSARAVLRHIGRCHPATPGGR